MSSRMDKYENLSLDNMSRTKRNQDIYNSTDMSDLSRIKTNTNVSVISDAPKEINLEKIISYVNSMEEGNDEKRKRVSLELPKEEEVVVERREEKDYDINSVLERARDKRESDYEEERHRKLNNTQIDILKNIKIKEETIETVRDEDITLPIDELDEELNTQEKTIVDLIQNIQSNSSKGKKELFEDLMGDNEDTVVMPAIAFDENEDKEELKEALLDMTQDLESIKEPESDFTREINLEKEALKQEELKEKLDEDETSDLTDEFKTEVTEELDTTTVTLPKIKEIDKSFYTNSMTFSKADFEGFEDLEKSTKKSGIFTKIAIVFIVLMFIATIVLILNFVLDWKLI